MSDHSSTKVHPVIEALEQANAATVVINGFLGTSEDNVVRLYDSLDLSSYIEIPKDDIIHMKSEESDKPGTISAFVRSSSEILSVHRSRFSALNLNQQLTPSVPGQFPTPISADACFYACAALPEHQFMEDMEHIKSDLTLPDSARNFRRQTATDILRAQLTECESKFGSPLVINGVKGVVKNILAKYPI